MPAAQRLALDLTALDFALDRDITPAPGALDRRPAAAALLLDRGPLALPIDCAHDHRQARHLLDPHPAAVRRRLDRALLAPALDCDLDLLALLLALFLGDRATAAGGTRFALNRHHR